MLVLCGTVNTSNRAISNPLGARRFDSGGGFPRKGRNKTMPTTEYKVYVPAEMVPRINEYCEENGMKASEAFREAMRKEL